jgi:hypothetical protein
MGEGRAEPRTAYAVLYAPTTNGRRAQRGATERSEFKKYFLIQCILIGFFSIISINLFFVWGGGQRGSRGECPPPQTPYFKVNSRSVG